MRISIRGLLLLTAIVALLSFVAVNSGLLSSVMIAFAIAMIVWSVGKSSRGRIPALRAAVFLIAAVMIWFAAIERSALSSTCPICSTVLTADEYRVLGIPVSQELTPYRSLTALIASDLGKPCNHDRMPLYMDERRWGLLISEHPADSGCRFGASEDWHDEVTQRKIQEFGKAHPTAAAEFHERVLINDDFDYLDRFLVESGLTTLTAIKALAQADELAIEKGFDLNFYPQREANYSGSAWWIHYDRVPNRYPGDHFMIKIDDDNQSIELIGGE